MSRSDTHSLTTAATIRLTLASRLGLEEETQRNKLTAVTAGKGYVIILVNSFVEVEGVDQLQVSPTFSVTTVVYLSEPEGRVIGGVVRVEVVRLIFDRLGYSCFTSFRFSLFPILICVRDYLHFTKRLRAVVLLCKNLFQIVKRRGTIPR